MNLGWAYDSQEGHFVQSCTDPSTHPMYTRSMAVAAHSRAVFRLSGEWGAATSGSRVLTSILQHRGGALMRQEPAAPLQGRQHAPRAMHTTSYGASDAASCQAGSPCAALYDVAGVFCQQSSAVQAASFSLGHDPEREIKV